MKCLWLLPFAMALVGCAAPFGPPRRVTPAEAAQIRKTCPEGTFIGAMTVNCPEIVR